MCNRERTSSPLRKDNSSGRLLPFQNFPTDLNSISTFIPGLEHYRLQLYQYAMAERLRIAHQNSQQQEVVQTRLGNSNYSHALNACHPGPIYSRSLALSMALLQPNQQQLSSEEPKPQHSYIGLIAMAILSSPEKKLVLSDIYQYILENYPYFRRRGPGWRNSIRHNLSLNDCFVKSGRSANGKGHYWAIHPANLDDFRRGDFRRRKAQRKVRQHMGLTVDEEPESPSPPPLSTSPVTAISTISRSPSVLWLPRQSNHSHSQHQTIHQIHHQRPHDLITNKQVNSFSLQPSKKRQFDVASLLAPDNLLTNTINEPEIENESYNKANDNVIRTNSCEKYLESKIPQIIKTCVWSDPGHHSDQQNSNINFYHCLHNSYMQAISRDGEAT